MTEPEAVSGERLIGVIEDHNGDGLPECSACVAVVGLLASRAPIQVAYACQRCGRRDGLDAVVTDATWRRIAEAAGNVNLLCLWCMDALAAELGIAEDLSLHFAGRAL